MSKLINNVIELGFWNIMLWFIFIMLVHYLVNSGFKAIETYMNVKNTIYLYDFFWLGFMTFVFVYGIYSFK